MTWVYDIEVFPNLFMVSFIHTETEEERTFIIGEHHNDLRSFLVFVSSSVETMIGFNNLDYDYPLIHPLLENWNFFWDRYKFNPVGLCEYFYKRSVAIIEGDRERFYKDFFVFEPLRKQIDLRKVHHLDNKHKRSTSLKWIEFAINHDVLQTFDYDPHAPADKSMIDDIVKYNLNDIRATYRFYLESKPKLEYRKNFGDIEGLDLTNSSDTKIAKKLFAKYLTDSMGVTYRELKDMRTPRTRIDFNDIIFDYVKFKTPMFQALLTKLKSIQYNPQGDSFKETVEHCGLHFDYGVGGLHAYPKKWITGRGGTRLKDPVSIAQDYRTDDDHQIIHVDVSSYYPNLAINNGIRPAHLGQAFADIYKNFYERRYAAKAAGEYDVEQAMKLSLNSVFGLTNDKYSYFYDPLCTYQTTINGQLLLTMLAEEFCLNDIKLIQCNTDGIYVYARRDQVELMEKLCDDWCDMTGLKLDYDYYDRFCQRDVNNYIGLRDTGKVTRKGAFRIQKKVHEDSSMMIVPMALEQYLLYDVPYREYISSVKEIRPFLMGLKIKGQDVLQERFLNEAKTDIVTIDHKKAVRYLVSKKGKPLYKEFSKSGNDQKVHSGFKCKIANVLDEVSRDDVDEVFYVKEVEKIASLFNRQQLNLFA